MKTHKTLLIIGLICLSLSTILLAFVTIVIDDRIDNTQEHLDELKEIEYLRSVVSWQDYLQYMSNEEIHYDFQLLYERLDINDTYVMNHIDGRVKENRGSALGKAKVHITGGIPTGEENKEFMNLTAEEYNQKIIELVKNNNLAEFENEKTSSR